MLIKFSPVFTQQVAATVAKKPFASFGLGLLTIVIFPIAALIAMLTIVGIPLALISAVLLIISLYIAKLFVSLAIGQRLLKKSGPIPQLAVGLLAIYILKIIPVLGGLVTIAVALTGLGALIIAKKNLYRLLRSKKII